MKTEAGKELIYLVNKFKHVIDTYEDVIDDLKKITNARKNSNQGNSFIDGDIVYGAKKGNGVENTAIYRDEDSTYFHWDMTEDLIRHWGVPIGPCSVLATEEQKQLLFDRLAKDNLKWNAETRKLEELNADVDREKVYDKMMQMEVERMAIKELNEQKGNKSTKLTDDWSFEQKGETLHLLYKEQSMVQFDKDQTITMNSK